MERPKEKRQHERIRPRTSRNNVVAKQKSGPCRHPEPNADGARHIVGMMLEKRHHLVVGVRERTKTRAEVGLVVVVIEFVAALHAGATPAPPPGPGGPPPKSNSISQARNSWVR